MTTTGIRHLKAKLSAYLKEVQKGNSIVITDHGKKVAQIIPIVSDPHWEKVQGLVQKGLLHWSGGKPLGSRTRLSMKGRPLSETLLEDRI